jgi:hypothetical protein
MIHYCDKPTPEHRCPYCQELLDGVGSFQGHAPEPDAISICAYCGGVMIITEALAHRKATPEETAEQRRVNPEFVFMEMALAAVRKTRKAGSN